jgi:integrase
MAREVGKLSARRVETARKPGRYSDGANLYLNVKDGGSKSWLFIYRSDGKQREMGLGGLDKVPLAKARSLAAAARESLGAGRDPILEKRRPRTPSFGERADAYIASHRKAWKNQKHIDQWEMTMRVYAASIRETPVNQVTTADVFQILEPIWVAKHETATRVRQRIESVMKSAKSLKLYEGDNPASLEVLNSLLPRMGKSQNHHPALPVEEMPDFMAKLRGRSSISALALEFTILTASRTCEVVGARWDETDELGWMVPGQRMKNKKPHQVPLSGRALEILQQMRAFDHPFIFPGAKAGRHLSNMAMSELLKDLRPGVTVHGFRSTFRDWASEHTHFSRDVCEMALAHTIESETEAAYRRGDLFRKRLKLMETWDAYCAGRMAKILPLAEEMRQRKLATA